MANGGNDIDEEGSKEKARRLIQECILKFHPLFNPPH